MQTYRIPTTSSIPSRPRAVALGFFDGVHIGHRAVISRAVGVAGTAPAVFTFEKLPRKTAAGELLTAAAKESALESLGVEELFAADFEAMRELSPEAFVRQVLRDMLCATAVCCGYNFHFGKDGKGDVALLRQLCAACGIRLIAVEPVMAGGEPVSSSRIRRLIEQGDMQAANRLLGRSLTIDATVVDGQHLGRKLGTPTINQPLPPELVRPRFGVYASAVLIDGEVTYGVTNIGVHPTVGETAPLAETWIPPFSGDLYGRQVPVMPVAFLRPETRFSSVEELRRQILADGAMAKLAVMGGGQAGTEAILFDFDDTLQNRPAAFRQFAAYFLSKYFPALSPAQKQARAEEMLRLNNNGYVRYEDYFAGLFERWRWRGAPPIEDIIREFQLRFPDYTSLFPETESVLRALRARGYRLGVITNGPAVQQNRKLDVSGLRPLLDIAVVSGDEGVHKPDPELFRRTAARMGVGCANCVYVGDHPVNDVEGARTAGMRPVYINAFGRGAHPAGTQEIRSLRELLDLLPERAKTGEKNSWNQQI